MFICPLCRQVANLDNTAFLEDENDIPEEENELDMEQKADDDDKLADVEANVAVESEEPVGTSEPDGEAECGVVVDSVIETSERPDDTMDIDSVRPPAITIPATASSSGNAGGAMSPSTPKNDTLSQAVLQDAEQRAAIIERKALLRSKLIKLAIEVSVHYSNSLVSWFFED